MAGPTSSGRVTRADVARLAGVSTAVVSYVLNGGPGPVSAASRQRVLRAVDALGYRPNANARALATGLSGLLGLVVPDISNPLFAEFALSIELCAQAKGYGLLLANSEDSVDVEQQQVASLVARGADGILLASVAPSVTLPRRGKTRVVLLNALRPSSDSTSVGPDALDGARLATEHLISHGHSSVGLIVGPAAPVVVEAREVGWLDAHTARRMVPGPVARDDFSRGGGLAADGRLSTAESSTQIQTCHRTTPRRCLRVREGRAGSERRAHRSLEGPNSQTQLKGRPSTRTSSSRRDSASDRTRDRA